MWLWDRRLRDRRGEWVVKGMGAVDREGGDGRTVARDESVLVVYSGTTMR